MDRAPRPLPTPAIVEDFLGHLRHVHARVQAGKLPGIPTGLKAWDRRTGGLQVGVHLLAAAPGAGKTTLALQIARHAAAQGVAVTYLAFDEGGDRLALKLAAGAAGLSATKYLRGEADPGDVEQALEAHRETLARIEIYGGPAISPADAALMVASRKQIVGTEEGLLVVDFLQAWAARQGGAVKDFRVAVTQIMGDLRQVSLEAKVPVLAIAAQNRQGQGEAAMSSLRESSDLEYVADSITFLVEEKSDSPPPVRRRVTLACLKNRWGGLFDLPLVFDAEIGRFEAGL